MKKTNYSKVKDWRTRHAKYHLLKMREYRAKTKVEKLWWKTWAMANVFFGNKKLK